MRRAASRERDTRLPDLLAGIEVEGSNTTDVEVEAAHGGPRSLAPTLSAFANSPGGGLLVLGVDERLGFTSAGVHDPADCNAALASLVRRGVEPPPTVQTWDVEVDGAHVVVRVDELDASADTLRAMPDEEVLFRTSVTVGTERSLTVAGPLTLGTYPQQHLPRCVVRASITPGPDAPAGTQALDSQRFDRPVPQMLGDAAAWVAGSTATRIRAGVDGLPARARGPGRRARPARQHLPATDPGVSRRLRSWPGLPDRAEHVVPPTRYNKARDLYLVHVSANLVA